MNNFKKSLLAILGSFIFIMLMMLSIVMIKILEINPIETNTRVNNTTGSDYVEKNFRSITGFTYKDHDYLSFKYRGGTAQIVHDPDCRKCKQD